MMKQQLSEPSGITTRTKKREHQFFDPVFALAAILEWAGIANNERGELVLTASYQEILHSHDVTEATR